QLLSSGSGFNVAGSYPNCLHVVSQIEKHFPDLVIMDIDMPGISGVEGVKLVKSGFPDVRVIMYTVFHDDSRIFDCICSGADGYLLKNVSPQKLIQSLHELMEGGAPMSPLIAQRIFHFFRKQNEPAPNEFGLTPRERQVLESLVNGNSYKMIAAHFFISLDTVRKHLKNIYHKLHVQCGTEAVAKAIRHKIIRLD
ncbi:MAG TPA: response regulator transcription factor, partial [Chitinophagaceae bacterium]|nr:response regulator transcription factor [Chitinophagaceae bacterium]